jgi:hypothetical protein
MLIVNGFIACVNIIQVQIRHWEREDYIMRSWSLPAAL